MNLNIEIRHVYGYFFHFFHRDLVLLRSSASLSRIIFVFLLFSFFPSNVVHYYERSALRTMLMPQHL